MYFSWAVLVYSNHMVHMISLTRSVLPTSYSTGKFTDCRPLKQVLLLNPYWKKTHPQANDKQNPAWLKEYDIYIYMIHGILPKSTGSGCVYQSNTLLQKSMINQISHAICRSPLLFAGISKPYNSTFNSFMATFNSFMADDADERQ